MGQAVSIRLLPGAGAGEARRLAGVVTAVDADGVTVLVSEPSPHEQHLRFAEIERARTTFAWGGEPKPTSRPRQARTPATARAGDEADGAEEAEEHSS